MELWAIWLIAAGILLIIELMSNIVATLCVAIGCLGATLGALCGLSLAWQIGIFAAATLASFLFLAPWLARRHKTHVERHTGYNTPMDALIGREALVDEEIRPGTPGRIRVDGDSWQAVTADRTAVKRGTPVRIESYDSIILTVKSIKP